MESSKLVVNKIYTLPVVSSDNPNYYTVKTDDEKLFYVKKIKFQLSEPPIKELSCLVRKHHDNSIYLTQNIIPHIAKFYTVGAEYSFRVKADYTRNNYYELSDEHGLFFRLPSKGVTLSVGQEVRCKVESIEGYTMSLAMVAHNNEVNNIPFWTFSDLKSNIYPTTSTPKWMFEAMWSDDMQPAMELYEKQDGQWIFKAIDTFVELMPKWFNYEENNTLLSRLTFVRGLTQHLLEGSNFLMGCTDNERQRYRVKLSNIVSQMNDYIQAYRMLEKGDYKVFVETMFSNLQQSGYLYQPDKQFRTFNAILHIHPQVIHLCMGQIFDALTNWELSNWQMEPFRSAFVKQTELYIRENQCKADEIATISSTEDKSMVSQMLMALAIQMLIGGGQNSSEIDFNRNRAMFYRYISYLNSDGRAVASLLDKAFYSVMGVEFRPEFSWKNIQQFSLLITLCSVSAPLSLPHYTLKTYSCENNTLEISSKGIVITHGHPQFPVKVLPDNALPWQNLQIVFDNLDNVRKLSTAKQNDLKANKEWWQMVENSLFLSKTKQQAEYVKKRPEVGDNVLIRVDEIKQTDNRTLSLCTIEDENYEGNGILNTKNIVRYSPDPRVEDFCDDETGKPLLLEATVIGIDNEGKINFRMMELVDQYIADTVYYGDESICVITSNKTSFGEFPCISELGYTLLAKPATDDSTEYHIGDFVLVSVTDSSTSTKIKAEIIEMGDESEHFHNNYPLHNILQGYSSGVSDKDSTDTDDTAVQVDETLTYDQVSELIAILRRKAFSATDYVQAFNYMAYARILARMVMDKATMEICSEHLELLILLHTFAKHKTIDANLLAQHLEKVQQTPTLLRLYNRLLVVSSIEKPECNNMLWEMQRAAASEEDSSLVKKVLTLNLLSASGGLTPEIKKSVIDQIGDLLNVNFYENKLKFYGTESQTTEFKTSIVFPPDSNGRADLSRQGREIVSVICGFLNADGGILYIGVNDQGYECGVGGDMQYLKVDNMDKYLLKIEALIHNHLGSTANDYITISADPDSKHHVAVVKIAPSLRVISTQHDDVVYVRHSTSTRPKIGNERKIFKADRELRRKQMERKELNTTANQ